MVKTTKKKLTLRDRKKAQPDAKLYLSEAEKKTIANTVAKNLDEPQRNIFFYTCQALGLNPLLNQICAVIYKLKDGTRQMSIQVMRDGFLTIAHRSGKFAGLESGVKADEQQIICGWAKVYHKDFEVPLYQEADFEEYNAPVRNLLWKSKPKTMIKKVAESMALRKAFNVSGVYAPEEMDKEIVNSHQPEKTLEIEGGDKPATEAQLKTIEALGGGDRGSINDKLTKQEAAEKIKELAQKKGKNGRK